MDVPRTIFCPVLPPFPYTAILMELASKREMNLRTSIKIDNEPRKLFRDDSLGRCCLLIRDQRSVLQRFAYSNELDLVMRQSRVKFSIQKKSIFGVENCYQTSGFEVRRALSSGMQDRYPGWLSEHGVARVT